MPATAQSAYFASAFPRLGVSWCCHQQNVEEQSVPLVTRAHFRSRDKVGGHCSICHIPKPMLHANFMALCFMEQELLTSEACWNGDLILELLCSCDLT